MLHTKSIYCNFNNLSNEYNAKAYIFSTTNKNKITEIIFQNKSRSSIFPLNIVSYNLMIYLQHAMVIARLSVSCIRHIWQNSALTAAHALHMYRSYVLIWIVCSRSTPPIIHGRRYDTQMVREITGA